MSKYTKYDGRNDGVKRWLGRCLSVKRDINELLEEIERVHALRTRITTVLRETTSSGGATGDRRTDATVTLIDLEERLKGRIRDLSAIYDETSAVIDKLPSSKQRWLMRLRYLAGMSFDQIGKKYNRDPRSLFRLHGRALENVRKMRETED